jgi:hypothetical protein
VLWPRPDAAHRSRRHQDLAGRQGKNVRRGINIARYSELADDGSVLLQVGFDIASQNLPSTDRIAIVDLPSAQVVSVIHKGSMDTMADSFDAMIAWATDSGYTLDATSRELYHEWHDSDPNQHITELQLPLAPRTGHVHA